MGRCRSDRCGYTFEENPQANCCYRETWKSLDRCIWHAECSKDTIKPIGDLKSVRETESNRHHNSDSDSTVSWLSDSEELLDGAQLSGQELGDEISFENCSLRNADFSEANLEKANFQGAVLGDPSKNQNFGSDFSNSKLEGSVFTFSNLRGANFSHAELNKADLTQLDAGFSSSSDNTGEVIFSNADLSNADLTNSFFRGADFSNADFSPNVTRIIGSWGPGITSNEEEDDEREFTFKNTDLSGSDFSNSDLSRIETEGLDFSNANLSGATLLNSTFLDSTMDYANLSGADLRTADLSCSSLRDADLTRSILDGTNLTNVDLRGATLDHVYLSENELDGINLNEETSFATPSGWELDADAEAEKGLFDNPGVRRLRAWNRSASASEDLQSAEIQYRLIRRLQREHDLIPSFSASVYEKHAKRKRALAENDFTQWINMACSRWILGYGLLIRPIIGTMIMVIIVSGLFYPALGFQDATMTSIFRGPKVIEYNSIPPSFSYQTGIDILHGIYMSSITFSTLGYGDLSPTGLARVLSTIESFVGGLLMAYLVFVLGRRVSR